jgi:hypothetical protein
MLRPFAAFLFIALPCLVGCGEPAQDQTPRPPDSNDDAAPPDTSTTDGPPGGDAALDVDVSETPSEPAMDGARTDASDPDAPPNDAKADDAGDASACSACSAFGALTTAGPLPSALTELSGIAASRRNPGVIYAHNDSGEGPVFFAMSDTGTLLGEYALSGVTTANDWKDVAVGSCPAGWCIYLGDIGDNDLVYATHTIYRVTEPVVARSGSVARAAVASDAFPFVYPDGRHNAETVLIEPTSGDLFIVTKVTGAASTVYRMPKPTVAGAQVTLERIGELSLPASAGLVTGGDVHPCGSRMLIRTYPTVYEFVLATGQPFVSIFATAAIAVATPSTEQESKGEGITYATSGLGYFTAGELDGKPSRSFYRVGCK